MDIGFNNRDESDVPDVIGSGRVRTDPLVALAETVAIVEAGRANRDRLLKRLR